MPTEASFCWSKLIGYAYASRPELRSRDRTCKAFFDFGLQRSTAGPIGREEAEKRPPVSDSASKRSDRFPDLPASYGIEATVPGPIAEVRSRRDRLFLWTAGFRRGRIRVRRISMSPGT